MTDTKNWKQEPRVVKISSLSSDQAKWSELQKIEWVDQTGKARVWESASRKTRGSTGVDAIAIAPILLHPKRPTQTLIIKQFRPPLDSFCIEFPAGLVDEGETVEEAALRELKEETGYSGKLTSITPIIGNDPGLTNANMQFATVEVQFNEEDPTPEQHLDPGEFIERFIVPLDGLYEKLMDFSKQKGVLIDARLFHFVAGIQFMKENGKRYGLGPKM
jgi:ADP-ribose pyrophosphatase